MPLPIILPIAGGAGLLWLWMRGEKQKIPPKDASSVDWQTAIADAIASGDPKKMRELARALDAAGYHEAAADLLAMAAQIESSNVQTGKPPGKPQAGGVVVPIRPGVSPGGGPAPISPEGAATAIGQAQSLANYLREVGKPSGAARSNPRVKAWQAQEGLVTDGKYGPKTAKRIAVYRVVPPKPWYWPKTNTQAALSDYRDYMLQRSVEDPSQADLWKVAAKVP